MRIRYALGLAAITMPLSLFVTPAALGGDWGYDDGPQSRTTAPKSGSLPTGANSGATVVEPQRAKALPMGKGGSTPKSAPGGGGLFYRAPSNADDVPGRIKQSGPFHQVQTGAGTYGVQLNPPSYEKNMRSQQNFDDDDPLHGRVPEGSPMFRPGGKAPAAVSKRKDTSSGAADSAQKQDPIKTSWRQLFELAGNTQLSDDQVNQLNNLIDERLKGGAQSSGEARAITSFWTSVSQCVAQHPEQKENYASLMRALLRWRARMQSSSLGDPKLDEMASQENALIAEVLGPVRVAVDGTPPFSEEALNAYTDMACFIYEQKNPGKSVDATDNRSIFANVVSEKYRIAPTQKDVEAMAGFDLQWAKFKIAWTESDDNARGELLAKLAKVGAGVAWAQVKDPVLELVLNKWPAPKTAPPVEPMLAKAQSYSTAKQAAPGQKPAAKSNKSP